MTKEEWLNDNNDYDDKYRKLYADLQQDTKHIAEKMHDFEDDADKKTIWLKDLLYDKFLMEKEIEQLKDQIFELEYE